MDEGDTVTITFTISGFASGVVAVSWLQTSFGGSATQGQDYTGESRGGEVVWANSGIALGDPDLVHSADYAITADNTAEPAETITLAVPALNIAGVQVPYTTTSPAIAITIRANDADNRYVPPAVVTPAPGPATPDPAADNPTARTERLEAPAGAIARGVGQLAAHAIQQRLTARTAANALTVAGRNIADSETLAAEYLAGAREVSANELLRQSGFNLTGGDSGRGVSIWGSGGYVSADGDYKGVDYDGDTSAFHLGGDTAWRDGLIGVAVARSDGDVDFNNTDNLETTVTSVHPYTVRQFNNSRLWTTIGYGTGDAELKEPGTVIKTDVKVLTAGFGITHEQSDLLTATIGALFNRAKLDSAVGDNKTLPAVTVSALRVTAGAEAGWSHGDWRPFLTVHLRHDAGDGDDGGAADLGGGVEWQTPAVHIRLAGSGRIQGQAADEQRLTLAARKTAGNLTLGLNLGPGLLHGEWRF
ncbi:MAG: autotransporter outer membrane beta-barrel domain-containing protein [Gammaproteobacteria bacterium]|nr:autotransporter outer membrane beta-barrel domain-containing protein [Gammaproteobacteria bacterium]